MAGPRRVACAALCFAGAVPLAGQGGIRATLAGAGTRQPIAGALVSVIDAAGAESRRVVTDETGRIGFDLPGGTYHLRVLRIGLVRWDSEPFSLGAGDTVTTTFLAPETPIQLAPLTVSAERRCRLRPEEGSAAATLWEESRKALEVTEWTIVHNLYQFRTVSYIRLYAPMGEAPREEHRTVGTGISARPFGAIAPESLSLHGFVQADSAGVAHYYGPDLTVLFSDVFVSQHCFKVRGGDHDSLIGLAFEPVSSRRLNDIRGTLWLGRASMELRRLEFRYTRLGAWVGRGAHGLVAFERLPSRAWVIRGWSIRMPIPLLGVRSEAGGVVVQAGTRDTVGVGGYREEGAHLIAVMSEQGEPVVEYSEEPQ